MATFTIDLLTGNLYLFSGNFSGSGSTPTSGSTYPQVNLYSDLPTPASSYAGLIYVVRGGSGTYVVNRKDAGLYFSNGVTWNPLPNVPAYFNSSNFQVYDDVNNTKGLSFVTSGLTAGIFRKLTVQNSDGTIAYLTDLNTKVDTSVFNTYTGATLTLINGKQNILIPGIGISISGNTISVTGSTSTNTALQLIDMSGGTEINTISPTPIVWTDIEYSGTSISFTGGSKIFVNETGVYGIGYVLDYGAIGGGTQSIGSSIRVTGGTEILPLTSSSFTINTANSDGSNSLFPYKVCLLNGNYFELLAFRSGGVGSVLTHAGQSWITVLKENI
jgi:hypothetical protein